MEFFCWSVELFGLVKDHQIANRQIIPIERTVIQGVENFTVFGAREWNHFYGAVGEQPEYPEGIADILNGLCPYTGESVKDAYALVLIPQTVNEMPLTLNNLSDLIQQPLNNGHPANYEWYDTVPEQLRQSPSGQSYWALVRKSVLQNTINIPYAQQVELVNQHASAGFEPPKALEMVVCIMMEPVVSGHKLFSDDPLTYTRCVDRVQVRNQNAQYIISVGGFGRSGLNISFVILDQNYTHETEGMSVMRKFVV